MVKKRVLKEVKRQVGLNFDGVNDYISLPNIGMPTGDFEFSVSVKVKITQTAGYNNIWAYGDTNNVIFKAMGLFMRDGKFTIEYNLLLSTDTVNTFGIGEYTITITKRFGTITSTINIYVNGVLQAVTHSNVLATDVFNLGNTEINIGKWVTNGFPFSTPSIFKMYQFHNRELTQLEIDRIASDGTVTSGLLRHYDFTEGQGFVLTDKSLSNQNGSLINYSLADVTIGNTNKWTYADESPYTVLNFKILSKLIEYDLGEGLKFNGVNNYISTPYNILFDFEYTESFSISAIIHTGDISLGLFDSNAIFEKWNLGVSVPGMILAYSTVGNIEFLFRSSIAEIMYFSSNVLLSSNEIYHIVVTYNNKIVTMYINGDLISHTTFGNVTTTVKNNSILTVGGGRYCSQQIIYDFKIFDKALTQVEADTDYYTNGQSIAVTAINNLVAWYPIQEQESFVIKDKSPNNLNGTMVNYSLADATVGANNKRVDKYGNPILRI